MIAMAELETGFRCRNCGKQIDIIHPTRWAYKVKRGAGYTYFCTWKCLREDEKKKNVKQAARKEETDIQCRNNRKEVLEKLIAAADAGRDIYDYLRGMGYTDPKDTLRRLRITAKKEAPEIYRKMEKMGLLDLRKGNSGKGAGKMSQNKLTRAQKEKAVEIAEKLPEEATITGEEKEQLDELTRDGMPLDEAMEEVKERLKGARVKLGEKHKTIGDAFEELAQGLQTRLNPTKKPVNYDGMKIMSVRGKFGTYSKEGTNDSCVAIYYEPMAVYECKVIPIIIDPKSLAAFLDEIRRAAQILGVIAE